MHKTALFLMLTLTFAACTPSHVIRKDGLKGLALGDPMPEKGAELVLKRPASDTTFNENNFQWWGKILDYPDGKVYLESDFAQGKTLNRIRIETSELELKNGLKVGSTWFDLRSKSDKWAARPFPEFGLIEAFSENYPKVVFLLEDQEYDFSAMEESLDPLSISPGATVSIIVLM